MGVVSRSFSDSSDRIKSFSESARAGLKAAGNDGIARSPYGSWQSSTLLSGNEGFAQAQYRASRKDHPYAAIRPIASRLAAMPIRIGTKPDRNAKPGSVMTKAGVGSESRALWNLAPTSIKSMAEGVQVETDHPLAAVLDRPNQYMSRMELLFCTIWSIQATGWGIWLLESDTAGGPIAKIWYLPRHWVKPIPNNADPFAAWELRPPGVTSEIPPIPGDDILAFRLPDPADPNGALSPIQANSRSIMTDDAIQETQAAAMGNFTKPGMVVSLGRVPGPAGQPDSRPLLDTKQRESIINVVKLGYSGAVKNGEPIILDALIDNVYPYLANPIDMDFGGGSAITKSRIHQGFGVNPISTGQIEGANRASAYVANETLCENVLNPLGTLLSEGMTRKIGPRSARPGEVLYLWLDQCRPRDADLEMAQIRLMGELGVIEGDEVRETFNLPPKGIGMLPPRSMSGDRAGGQPGSGVVAGGSQDAGAAWPAGRGGRSRSRRPRRNSSASSDEVSRKRAQEMVDVLHAIYGDDTENVVAELLGEIGSPAAKADAGSKQLAWVVTKRVGSRMWDESKHPRGKGGRFIKKGTAEALSTATEKVRSALENRHSVDSPAEIVSHLDLLTVRQLHELKKAHGIKASGTRHELVKKLADRLIALKKVSLAPFEGKPTDQFQSANLMKNGWKVGRINFGLYKDENGNAYGRIDDVHLTSRARGTNAMRTVYPQVESRLRNAGATRIKLNTVDDAVGEKVWRPLGFDLVGSLPGGTKVWEKKLAKPKKAGRAAKRK